MKAKQILLMAVMFIGFTAMAQQSDTELLETAIQYYEYGENEKAFEYFQLSANEGNVDAQFFLGACYDEAIGVEQDYQQAVKWYRKAAEQGQSHAQASLGLCYREGQGVYQSFEQSVYWFILSAEQGNEYGQLYLGISYALGEGVDEDENMAIHWLRKAADQDNADAIEALRILDAYED